MYVEPDVVFTCVPPESLGYVYPKLVEKGVRFERVLTGYVPNSLPNIKSFKPIRERQITVGYRGRKLSPAYGILGVLKFNIGPRVKSECIKNDVHCDIEWTEDKRIYGKNWISWLETVRATLVTESGANVFDFDGSIKRGCDYALSNNQKPSSRVVELIKKRDKEVDMAQISPRVFEALAHGCALVAYRGNYSKILQPDIHYICLEKDNSNIASVVKQLKDTLLLERLWKRAYKDLICSGRYTYEIFANRVRLIINEELLKKDRSVNLDCRSPGILFQSRPEVLTQRKRIYYLTVDDHFYPVKFVIVKTLKFFKLLNVVNELKRKLGV